jgi:quinol monooxygenase YgiN
MAFTQIIEARTDDVEALQRHVSAWHDSQHGVAPGYRQTRILADADRPGTYLIEVEFSSEAEAKRNNERAETNAWAQRARELLTAEPTYRNLTEVCTTEGS